MTTTQQKSLNWEKDFEELIENKNKGTFDELTNRYLLKGDGLWFGCKECGGEEATEDIKSFIRSLVLEIRKEEWLKYKELFDEMEQVKKELDKFLNI